MTMPPDDAMTEAAPVRRLEVFTGAGHRRTWSAQAKRQIVAESYSGLETACAVARRYGLAPTQLFTWRRELRAMAPPPSEPLFAPVVVETPVREPAPPRRKARRARHDGIELEIDGVTVRVGGGAQPHAPYPHFVEGARRCPPEDVGGTPGFEGFLEAVTTPRHPERRTMLDWYGGPFDPKDINRQMIEYRFAQIAKRRMKPGPR